MKRPLLFLFQYVWISSVLALPLGEMTVYSPLFGNRTVIYESVQGYAVVEGDILLSKVPKSSGSIKSMIHALNNYRWPKGVVPFEIAEDLPINSKFAVLDAIALWKQKTNVEFIELTSKNRDSYPDYVSFVPAGGTICASFVGRQQGQQEILLSPRCQKMNIVHEIGHALGLWHEQSRMDRDNYVRIEWDNIKEDHQYNFNQHLTDGQDFGEYDYDSIMHYGMFAFSKNGEKTIIPLVQGVEIGQRTHLSEKDIAGVNGMYPTFRSTVF